MPAALAEPHADTLPFVSPTKPRGPWVYDLGVCDGCGLVTERGHCPVCTPGPALKRRSTTEMMRERRRWLVKVDPIDERARRERLDRRTADRLQEPLRSYLHLGGQLGRCRT